MHLNRISKPPFHAGFENGQVNVVLQKGRKNEEQQQDRCSREIITMAPPQNLWID